MRKTVAFTTLVLGFCSAAWGAEHPVASVGASASEGYFMRAKVTKAHYDGTLDFWLTSVHQLPRKELAAADIDLPQLPKVIATLEIKSTAPVPRARNSGLLGSKISLRGKCKDIGRATRVSVIQVRQKANQQWRQAKLKPTNRLGYVGFKQIVARVCASERASKPASRDSTDTDQ